MRIQRAVCRLPVPPPRHVESTSLTQSAFQATATHIPLSFGIFSLGSPRVKRFFERSGYLKACRQITRAGRMKITTLKPCLNCKAVRWTQLEPKSSQRNSRLDRKGAAVSPVLLLTTLKFSSLRTRTFFLHRSTFVDNFVSALHEKIENCNPLCFKSAIYS